ncbi:hypothetical protein [Bradyrhizobium sp. BR 1432]|uniref:hypothetical protein n=1 Tax=Bradyrhizobium sp. BR 1432 TaxID=3447966 RepID=UPI003EE5878C
MMCSSGAACRCSAGPDDGDESAVEHWTEREIDKTAFKDYLKATGAAGGIAVISSLGQLGSFASPTIIGWLMHTSGHPDAALYGLASLLLLSSVILFVLVPSIDLLQSMPLRPSNRGVHRLVQRAYRGATTNPDCKPQQ